ncbi:N-acetyl-gamma-glutamyl-phosphate reductase [Alkalimonas collagenimarina]|uniref:N-acetyl-gamma-glutamyl-phosphate reductase n=1 Tax=Alkalimonas collagenimarina TaxID=400390 RepID=A0ABT9H230_9GAMM|nr:N-acetyl-gamma-glutamyl-phosphate reductase [Alkalimonas collagenimarina]MDP4537278.1 N-acetyl-gamma-glutamyl-phosphate reductase [Alkalimonas collagenimarina]
MSQSTSSISVKKRAIVLGAAGYSGAELVRLLSQHPSMQLVAAYASEGRTAEPFSSLYPRFQQQVDLLVEPWRDSELTDLAQRADVAFLALPHEASEQLAPKLVQAGLTVFDLSGAFRLKNPALYPEFYGYQHQHPAYLVSAPYGLAEWITQDELEQSLFAVAGCYPTASSLALLPLVKQQLLAEYSVPVISAVSGVSGAGRKASLSTSFCEVGLAAYGFFSHRHRPEIEQCLGRSVVFTPHLGNFKRGILATIVVTLAENVSKAQVDAAFQHSYQHKPLVRLLNRSPNVADVAGTPFCDLFWQQQGQQLVIVAAIDNLLKGAAAQAIQLANLKYQWSETSGLLAGDPYE